MAGPWTIAVGLPDGGVAYIAQGSTEIVRLGADGVELRRATLSAGAATTLAVTATSVWAAGTVAGAVQLGTWSAQVPGGGVQDVWFLRLGL